MFLNFCQKTCVLKFYMAHPFTKACECSHGKNIHHVRRVEGKIASPCNYPKCACNDYKPKKNA